MLTARSAPTPGTGKIGWQEWSEAEWRRHTIEVVPARDNRGYPTSIFEVISDDGNIHIPADHVQLRLSRLPDAIVSEARVLKANAPTKLMQIDMKHKWWIASARVAAWNYNSSLHFMPGQKAELERFVLDGLSKASRDTPAEGDIREFITFVADAAEDRHHTQGKRAPKRWWAAAAARLSTWAGFDPSAVPSSNYVEIAFSHVIAQCPPVRLQNHSLIRTFIEAASAAAAELDERDHLQEGRGRKGRRG